MAASRHTYTSQSCAPYIIGITGGIGSGKSVVSRILRLNGERVYDCDTEARRLMETSGEVRESLVAILGDKAYTPAGELCRNYVAERIFNDGELRRKVNKVVHTAVKEDFMHYACTKGGRVFCETAILATSGMDTMCDKIWVVTAPENERIRRVMVRNSLPEAEIIRRIDTQRRELDLLPTEKIEEICNSNDDMLLPRIYQLTGIIKNEEICLERF